MGNNMIGAFKEDAENLGLRDLGKRTGKFNNCPSRPVASDREFRLAERESDGETVSWCPNRGFIKGRKPRKIEVKVSPQIKKHIATLREVFDANRQHIFFSTPGFLDFHCDNGRITDVIEEDFLDENGLKGLVLK